MYYLGKKTKTQLSSEKITMLTMLAANKICNMLKCQLYVINVSLFYMKLKPDIYESNMFCGRYAQIYCVLGFKNVKRKWISFVRDPETPYASWKCLCRFSPALYW